MPPNKEKWFQDEHAKLRKQLDSLQKQFTEQKLLVGQLDRLAVKTEARLVNLEKASLKTVVAAIKDQTKVQNRIAAAIENGAINQGGMKSAEEQKAYEGVKERVERLKQTGVETK